MAKTNARTGVGELSALLPSWRLHLAAANLSPWSIRAYTDDGEFFLTFLIVQGMPTAAASIGREHVEAFIVAELQRTKPSSTATRYRALQLLFKWLEDEGEIAPSPMARTRSRIIPEQPVPVLSDDEARRLLADCSGKDFRDRRDLAIIRLFLATGMRLGGMAGLRYSADDPEASDVDVRSRVVRITAKGRCELVLPIGAKTARILIGTSGSGRSLTHSGLVVVAQEEGATHGGAISIRWSGIAAMRPGCLICIRTSCGTRSRMTGLRVVGPRVI